LLYFDRLHVLSSGTAKHKTGKGITSRSYPPNLTQHNLLLLGSPLPAFSSSPGQDKFSIDDNTEVSFASPAAGW
ncbi:hypothetical protein, partial [endosymbiont of Lamellibrachia barhami]|uniref:hypothetical protein n=1 Tax=endosymbiont of Lamellibrachia barhami TaxID=205975 RepID=UPI001C4D9626